MPTASVKSPVDSPVDQASARGVAERRAFAEL
jgi:hypothetical protein